MKIKKINLEGSKFMVDKNQIAKANEVLENVLVKKLIEVMKPSCKLRIKYCTIKTPPTHQFSAVSCNTAKNPLLMIIPKT